MESQYSPWNRHIFADAAVCDIGAAKLIHVAGMGAEDTQTGQLLYPGDVQAQTRYAFDRICNILAANDSSLAEIVRMVVYLTDMRNIALHQQVQEAYFQGLDMPVRTLLEVNKLAVPGMGVEIQVDAVHIHA